MRRLCRDPNNQKCKLLAARPAKMEGAAAAAAHSPQQEDGEHGCAAVRFHILGHGACSLLVRAAGRSGDAWNCRPTVTSVCFVRSDRTPWLYHTALPPIQASKLQ